METHIIYIITDNNRAYLEVGYCSGVPARIREIQNTSSILFNGLHKLNNVVYIERFDNREKALSYHSTLRHFTRMQREKLIRQKNPNWLNLNATSTNRNRLNNRRRTTNPA